MDRKEAISTIESLYPPDAPYERTAEKGQKLLEQAKKDVSSWKREPDEVLIRFAQLCIAEENRQSMLAVRKAKGKI